MPYFILFIVVLIAFWLLFVISRINYRNKLKRYFAADYYQQENKERNDKQLLSIKDYWLQWKNLFSHREYIDDFTWNDLDMDIIYAAMATTQSSCGDEVLYKRLRSLEAAADLDDFEKLINLFADNENLRISILMELFSLGRHDSTHVNTFLFDNVEHNNLKISLYYSLRILFFLSFLSLVFLPIEVSSFPIIIMGGINILVHYGSRKLIVDKYAAMVYFSKLIKHGKKIAAYNLDPHKKFKDKLNLLIKSVGAYQWKFTVVAFDSFGSLPEIIANYARAITLADYIAYYKTYSYIQQHQKDLAELYHLVGEIDSAIAVYSYRQHLPYFCSPTFIDNDEIDVLDLYHPLIENCVTNSINWNNNIIITGSNASGKSTFVKALAISLICAQSINLCFAKKLLSKPSLVMTSMAIKDSIKEKESYFIVELKSLKRIIDKINPELRCVCFIDEILRGTNTIERIAASSAILDFLRKQNCRICVASHDIELTEIMKNSYLNYHFSESIEDNTISFDYKLKAGPTTTYNAIILLEHFGYQNSIVDKANLLADTYRQTQQWITMMTEVK